MYDIPPEIFFRKVKNEKLEKTRNFMLEKYVISSYVTSQGSEKYQKIFFEEFFSFPKFKKKFHDNRTTRKKVRGGG